MNKKTFKLKKRGKKDKNDVRQEVLRHRRKERMLVGGLVGLTVLLLLTLISLPLIARRNTQRSNQAQEKLRETLNVKEAHADDKILISNLDMSVGYDPALFGAEGYIADSSAASGYKQSTGEQLGNPDNYFQFYIYQKDEGGSISQRIVGKPVFGLGTINTLDGFFEKRRQEYGNNNLSELDVTERYFQPKNTTDTTVVAGEKSTVTVKGVEYRRVIYTRTSTIYFESKKILEYYYTVQNGRPYIISVDNTGGLDQGAVAMIRGLMATVKYGRLAAQSAAYGSVNSKSDGTSDGNNSVNVPKELEAQTSLEVAAKNQPAVVRIGANYCADMTLLLPNGQAFMTIKDACNPVTGTGSIVSEDGYISTNGHVVRQGPAVALTTALFILNEQKNVEPLQQYLEYLVASGVMSDKQLNALLTAVQAGNGEAIYKLMYSAENIPRNRIKLDNEVNEYAIQLANQPLKLSQSSSKFRFQYSDTIVAAKYVDSDFDPFSGSEGQHQVTKSTSSDVAILKMEGSNFPVIQLGSIEKLEPQSTITAIGFPGFVDGGLMTEQTHTVPTVTQGHVMGVIFDSEEKVRRLVLSDTPISSGNSGGPALTNDGAMAGLNTYATPDCPDGQCFSVDSVFRDIADYKKLLGKNNINIKPDSPVTTAWANGISHFAKAHYSEALKSFGEAKQSYPSLYLAEVFIASAEKEIAAGNDIKTTFNLFYVEIGILVIGTIIMFILVIKFRKHRVVGTTNGYYGGQPATAPYPYQGQPYYATAPNAVMPPQPIIPMPLPPQPQVAYAPQPAMPLTTNYPQNQMQQPAPQPSYPPQNYPMQQQVPIQQQPLPPQPQQPVYANAPLPQQPLPTMNPVAPIPQQPALGFPNGPLQTAPPPQVITPSAPPPDSRSL